MQKKPQYCEILLQFNVDIFHAQFIILTQSWIFSIILQSHDPSEIIIIYWFAAQEMFVTNINVEYSFAA